MKTIMPAVLPRRQADEACHNATGAPVCQWEVFALVKALKVRLRLNDRDLTVLQAHLSVLPKDLREGSPKWSFKSVNALLEKANGMDDSTFFRAERRLEKRGLLQRNMSANGRRYPIYHPETRTIIGAYGIDLQPLFDRVTELAELDEHLKREEHIRKNLVTRISSWLSNIRRGLMLRIGDVPESFQEVARELRRITRRKDVSVPDLEELEFRLQDIEDSYLGDLEVQEEADAPCPSDNVVLQDVDHQNEWHIESDEKESKKMTSYVSVQQDIRTIGQIWDACSSLTCFYERPPSDLHQLAKLLYQFGSFIQIGERMTMIAVQSLGPVKALVAMDYLAEKLEGLRNPEGYLMSMVKAFECGKAIAGGRVRPDIMQA
ncbi:helix-turn-helix domain-containing protein [Pseudosulfitobacter pseudonitzschiae]|uniref:helix-turn-helix domain-containing protein n=1 Tax=Pseudosulfitobacter pseudonitzschiae TaxID=1402135 RepID=UPI003B79CEB3